MHILCQHIFGFEGKRRGRTQQAVGDAAAAAAAFTLMRKRRQDLTLGAKVMVLEMLEQVPKVPQGKIASMFRVSQSQVSRIMKNKEAIMTQWSRFATPDRKRCRLGKAGALEQKLVDWYKEAKDDDLPISGPILMEKAKSIVHSLEAQQIALEQKIGYLQKIQDELHQQKLQKEMKKVTQSPVVVQNPQNSLNTPPQEARGEVHSQLLGIQRSVMASQDLPQQEVVRQDVHHPVQHPDFMRQDVVRPEYRQETHQDRSRSSLVELRSVNVTTYRQPHSDIRNELRHYGKSDSMVTPELKNLSSDNHSGAELHHHGMDVGHIMREPDGRLGEAMGGRSSVPAGQESQAKSGPAHWAGEGIKSIKTTGVFKAINFELYVKPVSQIRRSSRVRV
ncbi:Tigger transposable element-derived protein 3 [Chionoecetes opilio]|uniref:Tigger transposable element-derived protein 3 n=1 Tax=Chionoecetes opilio TaxID=41210 RepID=A0A8J4XWA1_CHIOP|nr:Tigger transposable element-derived protein 3 [Chionoecetes opilio]